MKKVNEVKNKQNATKNLKQGFTLLELLVVVLIIGVLAGIALPQYRKAVAKAELAQLVNVVKSIANAQERYYLAQGAYAGSLQSLDIDIQSANNISCNYNSLSTYTVCHNKNFVLVTRYNYMGSLSNKKECYAANKTLVSACEALFNTPASPSSNGPCDSLETTSCYANGKNVLW